MVGLFCTLSSLEMYRAYVVLLTTYNTVHVSMHGIFCVGGQECIVGLGVVCKGLVPSTGMLIDEEGVAELSWENGCSPLGKVVDYGTYKHIEQVCHS
jgi:hypothetical protein